MSDEAGNYMITHESRSAILESPTQTRHRLIEDALPALSEGEPQLAEYVAAQLESLLNLRPLANHPEWFAQPGSLTLEKMRESPDLAGTPVLAKAEELFEKARLGQLKGVDEDPQTQLNFFRGNFHVKIITAFLMVINNKGIGSGIRDWLGDGYEPTLAALAEYKGRIEIRKTAGFQLPYLKQQIIENAQKRLTTPLTPEEITNYMTRIQEAPEIMPVQADEISRSFALAELMHAFLQEKLGKHALHEGKKIALLSEVIQKLTSAEPKLTQPLREFAQQEL